MFENTSLSVTIGQLHEEFHPRKKSYNGSFVRAVSPLALEKWGIESFSLHLSNVSNAIHYSPPKYFDISANFRPKLDYKPAKSAGLNKFGRKLSTDRFSRVYLKTSGTKFGNHEFAKIVSVG